jgi:predicted phosphodiesterase
MSALTELQNTDAACCQGPWALLADAHGNPIGLAAALTAVRAAGAKTVFFLGDAVGYLPLEAEVLGLLDEARVLNVMGNHDAMLVGALPVDPAKDAVFGLAAARGRLPAKSRAALATWPLRREIHNVPGGGSALMVHGGPSDPLGAYVYPDTPLDGMDKLGYRAIFLAQTHRPFIRRVGATVVVNVGSCGLPRDVGNLAAAVLYDASTDKLDLLRVPFDVDMLARRAERVSPIPRAVRECLARGRAESANC